MLDRGLLGKLSAAAVIGLALLAYRIWGAPSASIGVVRFSGYWITLLLVAIGVVWGAQLAHKRGGWALCFARRHWPAWCVALGGALLWQVHEPHQFKVLYDEHAYIAISKTMHTAREAAYPARAHYFFGEYYELAYGVDKRSVLFPFLVSVLHDLTGFRTSNAFVLNGMLGFASLLLIYWLLTKVSTRRVALCGQLMWIGIPLLAQIATGGGYDMLNICLLESWLILALIYSEGDFDEKALNCFALVTVALAQVRNESVLLVIGSVLVIWFKWSRSGRPALTWQSVLMSLFLVLPVSVNIIFSKLDYMRETQPGQAFFSLEYFPQNIVEAVAFVFNPDLEGMNSAALGYVGCFSAVLFLVHYIRKGSAAQEIEVADRVLVIFGGVIFAIFLIYMCTFWGAWTDYLVSRFSLPIWLLFLILAARVLSGFLKGRRLSAWAPAGVAVWAAAFSLPASAGAEATAGLIPARESLFLEKLTKTVEPSEVLIVAQSQILPIVNGYAATSLAGANGEPWKVQAALDLKIYKQIWVAEQYRFNYKNRTWNKVHLGSLNEGFQLEPVASYSSGAGSELRVSRIVAWKDRTRAEKEIAEAMDPNPKTRLDYFKQVIRLLP